MNQELVRPLLHLVATSSGISIAAARKKLTVSQSQLSRLVTLLSQDAGWLEVRDVDGAQRLHLLPAGELAMIVLDEEGTDGESE